MNKGLLFVFFVLLSSTAMADSFRCGNGVIKSGDSSRVIETAGTGSFNDAQFFDSPMLFSGIFRLVNSDRATVFIDYACFANWSY